MRTSKNSDYGRDFYNWSMVQLSLLKQRKFEQVDLKNLIEEVESLGTSQRSAVSSHLIVLLMHMLKIEYQPEKHTPSWDTSITNAQNEITVLLDESPSLKNYLKEVLAKNYARARKSASKETKLPIKIFPEVCPWTVKEILK